MERSVGPSPVRVTLSTSGTKGEQKETVLCAGKMSMEHGGESQHAEPGHPALPNGLEWLLPRPDMHRWETLPEMSPPGPRTLRLQPFGMVNGPFGSLPMETLGKGSSQSSVGAIVLFVNSPNTLKKLLVRKRKFKHV